VTAQMQNTSHAKPIDKFRLSAVIETD